MAAEAEVDILTITQSFVAGPGTRGSPEGSEGGIEWTFRGMIPGSDTDACTNEEKQT